MKLEPEHPCTPAPLLPCKESARAQKASLMPMTPELWKQVKRIFISAIERDPSERAAFLDRECDADDALRAEVESLIASHEEAESFIESPALEDAAFIQYPNREGGGSFQYPDREGGDAGEEMVGRRLGPYEVIREIGHGGMGEVYLGVRADDEYQKQVAIKLVRRGMDSDFIIRRFRNERQILANLDHPNIARLLDGGTTEDGLPYFVMEYVEGTPITDYCDSERLSINERLMLFRAIASAVHYAHQNLIVHRDIKPGNILVDAEGTPKLLDFGIAKLLDPKHTVQGATETETAMHLMTPEYASPEQVRGEPITTASDVYSLGVLLYELLTGHRPYKLKNRLPHEIIRVVCEEQPHKPSTSVTRDGKDTVDQEARTMPISENASRERRESPEKLSRRLAGDLDMIVLMAMRKEPQRRYASVERFSEDIRRHLEGLPVLARKGTLSYHAGKFIRRHKAGVAAALLILLTLVAGIVGTAWQARVARVEKAKAEQLFADAREMANSFMFDFHDAIQDLEGATPAREMLVKRALAYLDRLAKQASDNPSLQRELATAYQKVGDIQGRPGFANLGDKAGALQSYQKALEIRRALAAADPGNQELKRELGQIHERLGDAYRMTGNTDGALQNYQRALEIREGYYSISSLPVEGPARVEMLYELGTIYDRTGDLFAVTGNIGEALKHQRKALEIREALFAENPDDAKVRRALFISYIKTGDMSAATGDVAGALDRYRRALAISKALSDSEPTNARARRELAVNYDKIGNALAAGKDTTQALDYYRKALAIRESLAAADKTNAEARRDLTISYDKIGSSLAELGNTAEAFSYYRKALANDQQLSAADPANAQARQDLAISYTKLADILAQSENLKGALDNYRKGLAIREELSAADPSNAEVRLEVAESYSKMGELYFLFASDVQTPVGKQIENWNGSREWYQKALDVINELKDKGALTDADADEAQRISGEILRCDTALSHLRRASNQ